ncbi:MAG: carboxypeptidase-like regulatory domain-containing protein [Pyrinomonadaceae bacterium]
MKNEFQKPKGFDLNSISVAKPCPADWNSMTGDERTRHCGACGLNVHNIAGMTESDVRELIGTNDGRLCIRLFRRPDGTVITKDCPKGLASHRRRVVRFAGAALASILALFSASSYSQIGDRRRTQGVRSETFVSVPLIEGQICDTTGEPIPNATVTVTNQAGRKIERKTDKKGRFLFAESSVIGTNSIEMAAPEFSSFKDTFNIQPRERIEYKIELEIIGTIGIISIEPGPLIDPHKSSVSTTIRVSDGN